MVYRSETWQRNVDGIIISRRTGDADYYDLDVKRAAHIGNIYLRPAPPREAGPPGADARTAVPPEMRGGGAPPPGPRGGEKAGQPATPGGGLQQPAARPRLTAEPPEGWQTALGDGRAGRPAPAAEEREGPAGGTSAGTGAPAPAGGTPAGHDGGGSPPSGPDALFWVDQWRSALPGEGFRRVLGHLQETLYDMGQAEGDAPP